MMTERKALAALFEDLQEEKRQLKANYRTDLAALDSRMDHILNRLQRLDDLERESIDVEGTLHQLAATTKELAALIPAVPVAEVIEAAAAKMATQANETGLRIESSEKEKKPVHISTGGKKPMGGMLDVIDAIEIILSEQEKPVSVRFIEEQIKERYGWQWGNFPGNFSRWRKDYPNRIEKVGKFYELANKEKEAQQDGQEHIQPQETTV